MVVWFATIGVLGLRQIVEHPGVLEAINPWHIVEFFEASPRRAFLALGSIFLVVTGGEALYADMGHFGRRPIMRAWYAIVLPGLVLNYFGQAALLIEDPEALENPFYRLAPEWGVTPLAILATMASIIASQALISGAFSLTAQAMQADYLPRLAVVHTSSHHMGQVYVPLVNWALMIGIRRPRARLPDLEQPRRRLRHRGHHHDGDHLDPVLRGRPRPLGLVAEPGRRWSWPRCSWSISPSWRPTCRRSPTAAGSRSLVAVVLLVQMATWHKGRQLVAARIRRGERTVDQVFGETHGLVHVDGTAVFLFKDPGKAPPALVNNLRHNKVLHERTFLLAIVTTDAPRLVDGERRGDHRDRPARRLADRPAVRLHGGPRRARGAGRRRGRRRTARPRRRHLLRRTGVGVPGGPRGHAPRPRAPVHACCTAARTAPAGSSGCPPTGSSRWVPRSSSDRAFERRVSSGRARRPGRSGRRRRSSASRGGPPGDRTRRRGSPRRRRSARPAPLRTAR